MEQAGVLYRLVATIVVICLGFNFGICSDSDALIKTYVSSSLPSNDDVVHSAMLKVIEISGSEWESRVIQSELPVMVVFTATWCGPCRFLGPILDRLDSDYTDRFTFYTLDVDKSVDIALRYGIRGIPTTIVFKGGYEVARVTGSITPAKLYELVEQYV